MTDIRQIPEIQEIASYLRSMTFKKKVFGGCNTENVLDHFAELTQKYEVILNSLLMQTDWQARRITELQLELARIKEADTALFGGSLPFQHDGTAQPQPESVSEIGDSELQWLAELDNKVPSDPQQQEAALDALLDELFQTAGVSA